MTGARQENQTAFTLIETARGLKGKLMAWLAGR
jgi:hypothetical protein